MCQTLCAKCFTYIILLNSNYYLAYSNIETIIPVLQMGKLKVKDIK